MTKREKQVFECYTTRLPSRYHEIRAFPLGDGIGVAFRDVTDRQEMVETLRRRELELERVQKDWRRRGHVGRPARQIHGPAIARISSDLRPAA